MELKLSGFENGNKRSEINLTNGKYNGLCSEWYDNNQIKKNEQYAYGVLEGENKEWYSNGNKKHEGNFKNDQKNGIYREWFEME